MEPVMLFGAVGLSGACWLGCKAIQALAGGPAARAHREAVRNARLRAERDHQAHLRLANQQARDMQLALLRLRLAPDFRRAASFAVAATAVPVPFKQRQFRRFRGSMVRHFKARLAGGGDMNVLASSLTALLKALGIPSYEADYVRAEAERAVVTARRRPTASYAQRLAELQREHEERTNAVRSQPNLDRDTREQLLEAEMTRHREALDRLGGDVSDPPSPRS